MEYKDKPWFLKDNMNASEACYNVYKESDWLFHKKKIYTLNYVVREFFTIDVYDWAKVINKVADIDSPEAKGEVYFEVGDRVWFRPYYDNFVMFATYGGIYLIPYEILKEHFVEEERVFFESAFEQMKKIEV